MDATTDVTASQEIKKRKMDRIGDKPNTQDSLCTSDESTSTPTDKDVFAEISGVTGAISIIHSVEKDPPKPLKHVLPLSVEACTVRKQESHKSQESDKTNTLHIEPDGDDICAAILLACLFCHPLDCLLATLRGCNECFWSLCSSLCNCKPSTLQPLLDITQCCDFCGCLGICKSECQICDICLQATECLDLAMEISQMLYH